MSQNVHDVMNHNQRHNNLKQRINTKDHKYIINWRLDFDFKIYQFKMYQN